MNENITDSDIFINTYIKKQEEFTVKLVREKLELETRLQLVQNALVEKINEKNNVDELLKQSVTGVQSLTIERDSLKKEVEAISERSEAFRNKCEQLNTSLAEEQNKTRELTRIKTDYETLRNNYELVKNSHETLQAKLDELQAEKLVKKKRPDKENIN